jgi:hypothetical protein
MLRWFPTLQVATACFSCSPPDLNFLVPYFTFMYMHNNHCHRATANWQLNILLLLLLLLFNTTIRYGGVDMWLHSFLASVLVSSRAVLCTPGPLQDQFSLHNEQGTAWDADPGCGVWNRAMCCLVTGIELR